MVEKPLIPTRTLQQLQRIADRSKRSTCRIGRRPTIEDTRGGSRKGDPVFDTAVPCRLDPSGLTGGEEMRGEQMTSIGNASVALPLGTNPPDNEDVIEVTTPGLNGGPSSVEVFEVMGNTITGQSYAVEMTVPVQKIGN